ncbi:MAG: rhodanese-like domain-containing protein [Calditrichota bacterium]
MALTKQFLVMTAVAVLLGLGARVVQKSPVPFWGYPKSVELIPTPPVAIAKPDAVSPDSMFVPADRPYDVDLATAIGLYMKRKRSNIHFVDARAPELYKDGHVPGAWNIPTAKWEQLKDSVKVIPKNELIVAYCEGVECHDSHDLAEQMISCGWKRIAVFSGGWAEWSEETDFIEKSE